MGFGQIKAIREQQQADEALERAEGPVACPTCGEPLVERDEPGIRHCSLGHFSWPSGPGDPAGEARRIA